MVVTETSRRVYATLFEGLCVVGRPIGGIRPRRMYHWLAHRAFEKPEYRWYRNRWDCELYLSPYYELDRSIIAFGTYEAGLQNFVESNVRPGMVCLDVGANIGEVTMHMARKAGPTGRVLAFEPIPPVRARLERHVARNALADVVSIEALALSDRDGVVTMSYANSAEPNQGMGSMVNIDNIQTSLRVEVPTQRLDALVAARGLTRIDLIKLDVQGAEPLVLAGARETLERFSPDIMMEVSPVDLRCSGTDGRAVCASVEALGYFLYELHDDGTLRPLRADDLAPDFAADNVYCTKRRR